MFSLRKGMEGEPLDTRGPRHERAYERDWALAQRVLGGEASAAGALYERCVRAVAATSLRVLGRRGHEVEDAIQATFEQLMRSLDRYEGRCGLPTWASQIAAHTALNVVRARRRERLVFESCSDEGVGTGLDPDKEVEIKAALAQLGPEKARVVILHDMLGLGIGEVATRVGVSVAAAQSRLHRARCELRSLLGDEPRDDGDDASDEVRTDAA